MAAGSPVPNYYASNPLVAATLEQGRGVFHGFDRSPAETVLFEASLTTPTAGLVGPYRLLDYLLYYPFVDGDDLDVQVMDNTVALPRYADGDGVQAMLVAVAPTTGGGSFAFTYVNESGVERTSPTISYATSSVSIASIATSQPATVAGLGPFLPLASGDRGIRSVVSLQNVSATGGLMALVLVKPLFDLAVREINTTAERQLVRERMALPRVHDGAYLGWIMQCAATVAAGQLSGHARFAWS